MGISNHEAVIGFGEKPGFHLDRGCLPLWIQLYIYIIFVYKSILTCMKMWMSWRLAPVSESQFVADWLNRE